MITSVFRDLMPVSASADGAAPVLGPSPAAFRPSRYLLAVPAGGRVAVFGTRTGALALLAPGEFEAALGGGGPACAPPGTLSRLRALGMLVDAGADEAAAFSRDCAGARPEGLGSAVVAPTTACNARCWYCYEAGARQATMSTATADAAVDFLDGLCPSRRLHIGWTGGEPLLAAGVIDRVSAGLAARGVTLSANVVTNGSLVDEGVAEAMASRWGVVKAQVPVDGAGDAYERAKAYVDGLGLPRVLEGIGLMLEAGVRVRARVNWDPADLARARGAVELLLSRFAGRPGFSVSLVRIFQARVPAGDGGARVRAEEGALRELVREAGCEEGLGAPGASAHDLLKRLGLAAKPFGCESRRPDFLVIGPKGELLRCVQDLGRGPERACGDVFGGIRRNAWWEASCGGEPPLPRCPACPIWPICRGGCPIKVRDRGAEACCSEEACEARVERKRQAVVQLVDELQRRQSEGMPLA